MQTVMQAAILIGGKGTRLGGAVRSTPKPMLEVCGRPFVEHIMLNLGRFGFKDFLLLAGYQSDVVEEAYGPGSKFAEELQARISVVVEPAPLGTAGALKYARDYLQDEFLLINGDSIFDFNYLDLTNCIRQEEPENWLGRVALLPVEDASRYGLVELDGPIIRAFREKPVTPRPGLVNSGVYWLRTDILNLIGDAPCSLEQQVFPELVAAGRLVGRTYRGYFIDIGIPEDLDRARKELREKLRKPAAFLDRHGTLNHDPGYTHKIEDFRWMKGAKEAIKLLNDAGYLVFIVTNQAGIARGFYDSIAVDKLHAWIQQDLAVIGAHYDDLRYCPHHPNGKIESLAVACDCRKPATGMLLSLIESWDPVLTGSIMIGDSEKDILAGETLGLNCFRVTEQSLVEIVSEALDMEPCL